MKIYEIVGIGTGDYGLGGIPITPENLLLIRSDQLIDLPEGINNYTSASFSEAQSLITSNGLVPGTLYLINDFATVHQILNTTTINTGSVEPMLVVATSVNTLSKEARSLIYPQDAIEIDWTNILCEDGTTPRKGLITFRHDKVRNVSTYFDFRAWKVRRWQFNGFDHETGFVATTTTNITLTLTWSANLTSAYLTVYRKWEVKLPALVHDAGAITLTVTKGAFTHARPLLRKTTLLSDWTANELSNKVGPIIYSPELDAFILMDIYDIGNGQAGLYLAIASTAYTVGNGLRILPGELFEDYLTFGSNYDTGNVNNVQIGPYCTNNYFKSLVYNFTLGGYSANNTFIGQIATSTIGGQSNNNLFLGALNWSDIGGEFLSNVIGWDAKYFSIEGYSVSNNFLPGEFNFNAPHTYFWNTSAYCSGWGYVFNGNSVENSFIGLGGSNRTDMLFDKEVISSIVGYIASPDNLSFRKRLNSKYIHSLPVVSDHIESLNIAVLPTPVGAIQNIGLDEDGNVVAGSAGGGIDSVTGDGVNNTDPLNPIISWPVLTYSSLVGVELIDVGGGATYTFGIGGNKIVSEVGDRRLYINMTNIITTGTPTGQLEIRFDPLGSVFVGIWDFCIKEIYGSDISTPESIVPVFNGTDRLFFGRITDNNASVSSVTFTNGRIKLMIRY